MPKTISTCLLLLLAVTPAWSAGVDWLSRTPADVDYALAVQWGNGEGESNDTLRLLLNLIADAVGDPLPDELTRRYGEIESVRLFGVGDQRYLSTTSEGSGERVWSDDLTETEAIEKTSLRHLTSIRSLFQQVSPKSLTGYIAPLRSVTKARRAPSWTLEAVLAELPGIALRSSSGPEPRFSMWTDAESRQDALFLAAELRAFFSQGPRGDDVVAAIRNSLEVTTRHNRVEMSLRLSAAGLKALSGSEVAARFIRWDFGSVQRERRIRIDDLFDLLGARPGARIADVGAGAGFASLRMSRAVGSTGRIFAVDIDPKVLNTLRNRLTEQQIDNVEVVAGAIDDPGLDPDSLDGILVVNAYHEMTAYPKMLAHFKRALRPGGRLVILEPFDPEKRGGPRAGQTEDHHIAPELVTRDLGEAGFEVLLRDDDFVVDPSHGHDHREAVVVARPIR